MIHSSAIRITGSHWLVAFAAIMLGGAVYLFFRPSEPLFFHWLGNSGADLPAEAVRSSFQDRAGWLPGWVIYSLPNALWAFAYTLIMVRIWRAGSHPLKYLWFATIPVLVFGAELLQYTGAIPGTFDSRDLAAGAAGIAAGIITGISLKR